MSLNVINCNIGITDSAKPQEGKSPVVWKRAVPAATHPRIDYFTKKVVFYNPPEAGEPFFKRFVNWLKPLHPLEKPLNFAQDACEIAEQIPGLSHGAETLSETLSYASGVFSIVACIESAAAIEKRLNSRRLEEPPKLVKLVLSLLQGLIKSVKWMDQVGIVDLTKGSAENVKNSNAFVGVSSSLMTLRDKVSSQSSYKTIFQASFKSLVAVLRLCGYLFRSQLIKITLKPFAELIKGGFALNDHYNDYTEGKDSWKKTGLHLGDTLSSIALSLLALGAWYTEATVMLPTLVIALSLTQWVSQILIYCELLS